MASIRFDAAARSDVLDALDWYNSLSPALAAQFRIELESVIERISANPNQYALVTDAIRHARFRRFPYSLFFRADDDRVRVIACFHASRNPIIWQSRD
jgi:plasmid stabilization system protein ParE